MVHFKASAYLDLKNIDGLMNYCARRAANIKSIKRLIKIPGGLMYNKPMFIKKFYSIWN